MGREHVEAVKREVKGYIAFAKDYDEPYRGIIVDNLCRALLAGEDSVKGGVSESDAEHRELASGQESEPGRCKPWDYRKEMFRFAQEGGVVLKKLKHQQLVALLAYVLEVLCPKGAKAPELTSELLIEACRMADQRVPADAGSTLRAAKSRGYLDKAIGRKGYTLTAKSENLVRELVSDKGEE